MKLQLKIIFSNIKEKKLRSFIMLLTLVLSSALFFASISISTSINQMIENKIRAVYGTSDIVITNEEDQEKGISLKDEKKSSKYDYVLEGAITSGLIDRNQKNYGVTLLSMDIKDLQKYNSFSMKNTNSKTFEGDYVLLGNTTAEELGLKKGDKIDIELSGIEKTLTVYGIAEDESIFQLGGIEDWMLVPKGLLKDELGLKNNVAYLKAKDFSSKSDTLIKELEKKYPDYTVERVLSEQRVGTDAEKISTIFLILTVMISFVSFYIIFLSFHVIVFERLKSIGIYRSLGANKGKVRRLLSAEAMTFGVSGGVLGGGLGILLLYLMIHIANDTVVRGSSIVFEVDWLKFFITVGMSILISFISSIIPVILSGKYSIKDLILTNFKSTVNAKFIGALIAGVILFAAAMVIPEITSLSAALNVLFLVFVIAASALLAVGLCGVIQVVFRGIYRLIFKNEGVLALENLPYHKNNLLFLTITLTIVLAVNFVIFNIMADIQEFHEKDIQYHYRVDGPNLDEEAIEKLEEEESSMIGTGVYQLEGVSVSYNQEIGNVEGLDISNLDHIYDFTTTTDRKEIEKKLEDDDGIVINYSLKVKLNKDIGDTITLKHEKETATYKVVGICNTRMSDGNYAFISDENMKEDFDLEYFSYITLKDKDNKGKITQLEKAFKSDKYVFTDMGEVAQMDLSNNQSLFLVMEMFLVLLVIVVVFGIANNLVVSFMQRKKQIGIFRAIGCSRGQILKIVILETFTAGLIGGFTGVLGAYGVSKVMPHLLISINTFMNTQSNPTTFLIGFLSAIAILLVISANFIIKVSKLNILHEIKYE